MLNNQTKLIVRYGRITALIVFAAIHTTCLFGQQKQERQLLDVAILKGVFIYEKPIAEIYLDRNSLSDYDGYLRLLKEKVDSSILLSIIGNMKVMDSSHWKQAEIPNSLLVKDKMGKVDLNALAQKVPGVTNRQLKNIRKLAQKFNRLPVKERLVKSYSRPVYDSSGKYAVIEYVYPHADYGVLLFHYTGDTWKKLGPITVSAF